MKFEFNTTLENVTVPGAEVKIGKIDVSISMEMADESYNGLVEMVYGRMAEMFGLPSTKTEEPTSGPWQVYCREDTDAEGSPGEYVRATSRTFETEEEAKRYADGINPDREAFVTTYSYADLDESPF